MQLAFLRSMAMKMNCISEDRMTNKLIYRIKEQEQKLAR
jgi:hypothetical protein